MLQIQLYIENQEVELYKDESITLTQSIQDVRDIEKIFTDYSRTFSVPASKQNNKIFQHFYNYFIEGFDARRKKEAQLLINYKPFRKGKIKLEGVQLKNNEPHTYRITFFGNTVTLPDLIGEDKLANLTELSAFDFRYNDTNIQTYMSNGLDQTIGSDLIEDGIIFPLITHTNRLIYDSGANDTYNLYTTGSNNGVPFAELKPAIRIEAIIKAIELHYNIEFSTDFFNSTNAPYHNLYMWLHTKPGGLFSDQERTQQFTGYGIIGSRVDNLTVRSNNFIFSNRRKVDYDLRFTVTPATDDTEYNLVIHRNGEEFKRFDSLSGATKNGEALDEDVDYINVEDGEFSVFIETASAETFDLSLLIKRRKRSFIKKTTECTLEATLETFTDTQIAIASQIPDMKVLDFLTGLFKMFNLTAYVNDDGLVVVQTLDSYFASSTTTHDITPFVVTDESQVDATVPYRQVNLKYEGLNTFLAKNFNLMNNKGWGTLEYQAQAKFEGQTYEIKLPFEHMLYERLQDVTTLDRTNIMWGWYVDEKQETISELPLLFYPVKSTSTTIAARTIAGSKVDITEPYMPSNSADLWSSYRFEHMEQSLNFHSEFDEYAGPPNERTLFKTYYETYIKDLFDLRKRITKISAYLPISVTQKLSLADNIIIFNKLYRINTITTNFETNKSELELTNILDNTVTEAPTNIAVSQVGTPVDVASNDVTADTTVLTADRAGVAVDGFEISDTPFETPTEVPNNDPVNTTDEVCEVTAASILEGAHSGTTDTITFKYSITKHGKLCGQDNIDEFGFLIATTSSALTASDDIDTLKASSSVTAISTVRPSGQPTLSPGEKQTYINSLTDPATRYARFYVRTNINPDNAEADVISAVFSESTVSAIGAAETEFYGRQAGYGAYGYSTIPSLATIRSNFFVQNYGADCGETAIVDSLYHNGDGAYPMVGDEMKTHQSFDYTGGSSSAPASYNHATNIYYAMAIADGNTVIGESTKNGTIFKYVVVKYSTAEVVAVYDCPEESTVPESVAYTNAVVKSHTNMYVFGEYQGSYYGQWYIDDFKSSTCGVDFSSLNVIKVSHNGSGDNPVPGDYIKIDHYNGVDYTTSFGQTVIQLGIFSERITLCLVDSNSIGRYLVGFNRIDGEVMVVSEC